MSQRLLTERRGATLCYKAPQDVYASGYFDFARHGHELFVKIRVPYTRNSHVFAYRSRVIPLPVPGEQGLVTQLKNFPQIFVMMTSKMGELAEIPSSGIVDDSNIQWYAASQKPCALQVFNDWPGRVLQYCDFVTHKGVIEPEAIRLTDNVILVTNASSAEISCNGVIHTAVTNCTPCIVTLDCNCTLHMGDGLAPIRKPDDSTCPLDQERVSVAHAINLIMLQTFYDMENTKLNGSVLFQPESRIRANDIVLPLFSDNTTKLLASDQEASYSLRKLAAGLQNQSVVLHGPSEALLYDYLQKQTALNSFWSFKDYGWVSYAVCIQYGLMGAAGLYVYIRSGGRTAGLAIAGPLLLPKTTAYGLRTMPPIVTSTTVDPVVDWMYSITVKEWLIIMYCVFLSLWLLYTFILTMRAFDRYSYLYMQFSTGRAAHLLKYRTLPDATRQFTIMTGGREPSIKINNYGLFSVVSFISEPWLIKHSLSGEAYKPKKRVFVGQKEARLIRQLLMDPDCCITPLVVHTHEYAISKLDNSANYRSRQRADQSSYIESNSFV